MMEEAKRHLELTFASAEAYIRSLSRQNDADYRTGEIEAQSALVNAVSALYEVRYILGIIDVGDVVNISRRYQALLIEARSLIVAQREAMQRRLNDSLTEKVAAYADASWVTAIREGMTHEFWFVLTERDKIEAMIQSPLFLSRELSLQEDLEENVRKADQVLRDFGPELWKIDQPTGTPPEERRSFIPPTHWWWWLDS